jgi:aldehyde dehydrogenase (NAD+)
MSEGAQIGQNALSRLELHRLADPTPSIKARNVVLRALRAGLRKHEQALIDAMAADLGRPELEARMMDIYPVRKELDLAISKVGQWAHPRRIQTPLALTGTRAEVRPSPKGVVLVLAPWNYPVLLTANPSIAALAAGNRVVVKPSEHTPKTAQALADWFNECAGPAWVEVLQGGADLARELTSLPFNHIYFTGGPLIGKHIVRAAAEHLTPLTLELGGKSPAIVDSTADLQDAARRIAWGKWINAGQVCISPDYILVEKSVAEGLLSELKVILTRSFSRDTIASKDYSCIVNRTHFDRLKAMLDDALHHGATVVVGGRFDAENLRMEPTILTDVTPEMRVMREEVFGPLLPLVSWTEIDDVPGMVAEHDHPLALYLFSKKRKNIDFVLAHTRSGSVAINETIFQNGNAGLPFGGIQGSGWGRANGKAAYEEFTNFRSVLRQTFWLNGIFLLNPPYTGFRLKVARLISRYM